MRLEDQQASRNVDDRRGMRVSPGVAGGGLGTIAIVLLALFFGIDPSAILQGLPQGAPPQAQERAADRRAPGGGVEDEMRQFVAKVLGTTEMTWNELFAANGRRYEEPQLVLFDGVVRSACGTAQAAVGPFYCGLDRKVYIDLSFYRDLRERFKAPGDFAQAYVIAHEVGHHVQNLLGIMDKVNAMRERVGEREANALSVRLELQADCFAGIWAHHSHRRIQMLEHGDVEEGLNAATQIGDDRIQMRTRGYVTPDSFTHGSGAQRVQWFRRGLESGDMRVCDTFR